MTIVVTGGGSGGHITPILAVAHELKKRYPDCEIVYIGQKGDPFADKPAHDPNIDQVYKVSAGKFRRYYGEGLKQLFDVKTMYLNLRDVFRIINGLFQARRIIKLLQPDVVFSRGGYVSVPVCLAGKSRGVPYITHDSDAVPSLANRIIAPWAAVHAVALPKKVYPYNQSKTVTTGVPVRSDFTYVTPKLQQEYKKSLGIQKNQQLLFVIGGGLGSKRLNDALLQIIPDMLTQNPRLRVVHIAGENNQAELAAQYQSALPASQNNRVTTLGYVTDVYRYSGAADAVVTRAGASSLADLAVQGKACVVVPSPFLVGGHQLKNADFLAKQKAISVVDEAKAQANPSFLREAIEAILDDADHARKMGDSFVQFGHADSAKELAELTVKIGNTHAR